MDPIDGSETLSGLTVPKDVIIESVAERILLQENPVAVLDNNKNVVGSVRPSKLINVLFSNNSKILVES
jgi:glycine betaine/proline transport system ATP-binding protein